MEKVVREGFTKIVPLVVIFYGALGHVLRTLGHTGALGQKNNYY